MDPNKEEETHPVLEAVKEEIHIVPYTKRDRRVNYFIAIIVALNLAVVLIQIPWGSLWS